VGSASEARASLPSGATPFGAFPSTAASLRHRSPCPLVVWVVDAPGKAETSSGPETHLDLEALIHCRVRCSASRFQLAEPDAPMGFAFNRTPKPILTTGPPRQTREQAMSSADTSAEFTGEPAARMLAVHRQCRVGYLRRTRTLPRVPPRKAEHSHWPPEVRGP